MHKQDHTSANIRFYEKEGLTAPRRNDDNNYREYPVEKCAERHPVPRDIPILW